jgi:hypothetical protein
MVWLFELCYYYKKPYLCFLVSRISYITSLSFLLLLIKFLHSKIVCLINTFVIKYKIVNSDVFINERIDLMVKDNELFRIFIICLKKIYNNFGIILRNTYILLVTLTCYFMLMFSNYSLFVMGQKSINNKIKFLIYLFIFFFFTYIISFYVLGISRIFLVWFIMLIFNTIELFFKYKEAFYKDKTLNLKEFELLIKGFIYIDFYHTVKILVVNHQYKNLRNNYNILYKVIFIEVFFDFISTHNKNVWSKFIFTCFIYNNNNANA